MNFQNPSPRSRQSYRIQRGTLPLRPLIAPRESLQLDDGHRLTSCSTVCRRRAAPLFARSSGHSKYQLAVMERVLGLGEKKLKSLNTTLKLQCLCLTLANEGKTASGPL